MPSGAIAGTHTATGALAGSAPLPAGTLAGTVTGSGGDFTVTYPFGSGSATNSGTDVAGGTLTIVGVTGSTNFTAGGYASSPVGQVFDGEKTAEASITAGKYVQFTLTPDSGVTSWSVESLTMNAARGGGSTPRGFAARTSHDGYAADLSGGGNVGTQRPTWSTITFDTAGLTGLTGSLTVRLYHYAPAFSMSLDFDDITVEGSYETSGAANTGSLAGTAPLPAGALTGVHTVGGASAGTAPLPAGSLTGVVRASGAVAGTSPLPFGTLAGGVAAAGALAGALPLPTSALTSSTMIDGTLAASLPLPSGEVAGTVTADGALAGTISLPAAQIAGDGASLGALAGTISLPAAQLDADVVDSGALAGAIPLPAAALLQSPIDFPLRAGTLVDHVARYRAGTVTSS